jgi:hypothetical protein
MTQERNEIRTKSVQHRINMMVKEDSIQPLPVEEIITDIVDDTSQPLIDENTEEDNDTDLES